MIVVLVAAAGAAWESPALEALGARPDVVVLKRCVDVDDLMATASSGQAHVALVALGARGLDPDALDHLGRHGVRAVGVADDAGSDAARARAARIGLRQVVADDDVAALVDAVTDAATAPTLPGGGPPPPAVDGHGALDGAEPGWPGAPPDGPPPGGPPGRVVAVWGPAGAPGRTTLAVALAAEVARRGRRTVLVDADPYGGSVAQQLGVLDEVSGLLAAARLVTSGALEERFATVQRGLDARLSVVTGLPRPDRWTEVRPGTLEHLLDTARRHGDVVVDTGFCLEHDLGADAGGRPGRNHLTLTALDQADDVLVVGAADPVGLARLARGLADLHEATGRSPVAVVNRMRPSLGWSERDVAGMLTGVAPLAGLHFLPDDRVAVDKALVAGRTLLEVGEGALTRAVADVADRVRPRTAGTARPR